MHYVALLNDAESASDHTDLAAQTESDVEVTEIGSGAYQVVINGRVLEVDARFVADSSLSMIIDNNAYNVEFERKTKGGERALLRGYAFDIDVLDLRKMNLKRAQASAEGPDGPVEICSPMPGKVVAVLVKEGTEVEEGQGIIVVEAMKMENELRAPKSGKVVGLVAEEGAAVDGGTALCTIE